MSQIGHWELDIETGTIRLSEELFSTYEIDQREFPGTYFSFLEAIHANDRERVSSSHAKSAMHRTMCTHNYQVGARSGKVRILTENVQTIYSPGGSALRSIATVHSFSSSAATAAAADDSATISRRLAAIVESSDDAIVSKDINGIIRSWNRAAEYIFGYAAHEIIGKSVSLLLPPDRKHEEDNILRQLRKGLHVDHFETVRVRKDGQLINVDVTISPIRNDSGHVTGASKVARDITERKRIEAALIASAHEKEILLREIHHRVKNNLQIIASLLSFQSRKAGPPENAAVFVDGQNRLKSMILVHDKLYGSRSLSCIEFGDYVSTLAKEVAQSYRGQTKRVNLKMDTAPLQLPIAIAQPCGMLVTELLTNAYKYAFPEQRTGTVHVQIRPFTDHFRLAVADDGIGLPSSIDPLHPTSFGMQLAANLAAQMGTKLHYESGIGKGVSIEADIPMTPKASRKLPGTTS